MNLKAIFQRASEFKLVGNNVKNMTYIFNLFEIKHSVKFCYNSKQ